jgi:AcrR family transcriptional regulator
MRGRAARPVRMAADTRRELVLAAATRSFALTGFAGTSTDAVAREAGVSQPYVVRIFGTKQDLFLATYDRAADQVHEAIAAVVRDAQFDASSEVDRHLLGGVFAELLRDRDLVLVLLHGVAAGDNPAVRERARDCTGRLHRLLTNAGMSGLESRDFLAHGLLLTVLIGNASTWGPDHLRRPP